MMSRNDWIDEVVFSGMLLGLLVALVAGGFVFGLRYQLRKDNRIISRIPMEMEGTCQECSAVGFDKGRKSGMKICDDVLQSLDDASGRY